jgi:transposase
VVARARHRSDDSRAGRPDRAPRKKPGRPIDFGDQQKERYKGRNVVERCFNRLKQWRGTAMRSDKLLRSYRAAVSLAATLIWIKSDLINTA